VTLVGGAGRAVAMLTRQRVRLVLAGHLHRGYVRFASAERGAPLIVQGATATSVRLRGEPNAYNRISIDADGAPVVRARVWDGVAWTMRPSGIQAATVSLGV
jgi:3',5'-cyclic AMP phosphodiesterase CpdA